MKSFFQEFKEFAVKGNLVDLAIGVIIGTAFNKLVSSLVKDIIMPPFGLVFGDEGLSEYKVVLKKAVKENGEVVSEQVAIKYGEFLQVGLDFVIVALTLFVVIKAVNSLKRRSEDEGDATVPTPKDIKLLSEIRDLLKEQKKP